jgi:prenyltransferase beta subunit
MLQVARLAPKLLGDSAELVRAFLLGQQNEDGGFKDRAGRSDLYYTVFALDGLVALQAELPAGKTEAYLRGFKKEEDLDFVHLCCLIRSWAALHKMSAPLFPNDFSELEKALLERVEKFRAGDGGYNPVSDSAFGTAYGCFLALSAYQDFRSQIPDPSGMGKCLESLKTSDGAWSNDRKVGQGSTNATAAAVSTLRQLQLATHPTVGDWLLARCHPDGGFLAAANAPMPDLLSTATALHALSGLQRPLEAIRERCLDFVDTLWTNEGGFHGHWGDDALDCEYTFYGLLALGHLAV